MSSSLCIELAGTTLWLLADKAIYYPAERALLVADAHFGKAAAYRKLGQPVPHGTTDDNLRRLNALLKSCDCERLIFLGDFLHAPESHSVGTLTALQSWRAQHASLSMTLIRGNHDKRAGDPPAELRIDVLPEPLLLGPFALQHEPAPHPGHHVLAGHVHPVYWLYGKGRQRLRLPCFYVQEHVTVLPAFGAFTGGMNMQRQENSRIFVVGDGTVWEARQG